MLPKSRGQQYRVRGDVRARLTRGLAAPLIIGLLPDTRLHRPRLPTAQLHFHHSGATRQHKAAPKIRPGIGRVATIITPNPHWSPGVHCFRGGVLPWCRHPVRRHRHRCAVVPSHVLITGDECRRTSRGRHSAPRAPQGSGATIPGTQRRPGQTHTRARGTIESSASYPTHAPSYQKLPKGRSIFIIPGAAKRHKGLTPNCQRLFARSRHTQFTARLPDSCGRLRKVVSS